MKHLKRINEYHSEIKTPAGKWKIKLKTTPVEEIDLNDKTSTIKVDGKYNFLGVSFSPKYNTVIKKYSTIIQKQENNNNLPGWVIYSDSLEELKSTIRFKIKKYIKAIEDDTINDKNNMEHLKSYQLFLEYNSQQEEQINYILDKISKDGIDSLSPEEKNMLDSQKSGSDAGEEALKQLIKSEKTFDEIFTYDNEFPFPFKFELKTIDSEDSDSDDGIITTYYGIITLPNITTGDGEIIDGTIEGEIQINEYGLTQTNFSKNDYSDYDFCEGLEYEYDSFIQNVSIDLGMIEQK